MKALSCVLLLVKMSSPSFIRLIYLLYVKKKRVKETQLKSNQHSYPISVDGIYEFSLTVILYNVFFTSSA